jgi:hypothetical protein
MNQDNRVLGRKGARELTPEEAAVAVGGAGIRTLTLCTAPGAGFVDGDAGECG